MYTVDQNIPIKVKQGKDGLFASTDYKLYMTFQDGIDTSAFSPVSQASFTTLQSPPDRYAAVSLTGVDKPKGKVLDDVKKAYSKATGMPIEQITVKSVVEKGASDAAARRRLAAPKEWEVLMQLVSDPSGASTVTPDYIINEKSADNCVTCLEEFISEFEQSESASDYATNDFGQTETS